MERLSVVMICYNEEEILEESLVAVKWADEIVVVDSFSTDRTCEIARRYTEAVFQHPWQGYGRQKNLALGYASCPWVLSLDADEVVSPALAREIQSLLARGPGYAGYMMPRMTYYLGRFLRHAWYPDHKLRLFQKDSVRWGEEDVHESLHLNGDSAILNHPLFHHSFRTLGDHIQTIQSYTTLGANMMIKKGRTFSLPHMLVSPLAMFVKQYVVKRGFLDGVPGLIACVLSGVHEFVKYAKLYELDRIQRQTGALQEAEGRGGP